MNDRLTTAAGALLAVVFVFGLFYQPQSELPVSKPTSAETGPNGYVALARWLDGQRVPVVSFQERYGQLGASATTATGNLLITTMPHELAMRADEQVHLHGWIRAGNTLVVMAALNDTPDWSTLIDTSSFLEEVEDLTGTRLEAATDEDGEMILIGQDAEEEPVELAPTGDHPLMEGVAAITGITDLPASIWVPTGNTVAAGNAFAVEVTTQADAAWQIPVADGHIILLTSGSLLTNRALGNVDNRQLVANILRWHLGPGGALLFDDMHHGMSTLYDPEAFYEDSRVGATILFILAFWFLYMIGTQGRMAPALHRPTSPRQGDFVSAIGGFMARKVSPTEAGLLIFEEWFEDLRTHTGTTDAGAPWRQLLVNPTVDPDAIASLQSRYRLLQEGKRVDLGELHNSIRMVREAMG